MEGAFFQRKIAELDFCSPRMRMAALIEDSDDFGEEQISVLFLMPEKCTSEILP